MANVKLCDRCGAMYEYSSYKPDPNAVKLFKANTISSLICEGPTRDLCPDCMCKLEQFLANEDMFEPARQKVENAYNALLADPPNVDAATGYLGEVLEG